MNPLTLRFEAGEVEGEGQDCIGPFTFAGIYTDAGEVRLVKQYLGQHAVHYHGSLDEEGSVVGRWSVGPDWSGPFALMPMAEAVQGMAVATATSAEVSAPWK
jgi:hypothetical protein